MLGTACEKNKSKTCEPKGTHTHSELHRTKPDVVVFCPTGSGHKSKFFHNLHSISS